MVVLVLIIIIIFWSWAQFNSFSLLLLLLRSILVVRFFSSLVLLIFFQIFTIIIINQSVSIMMVKFIFRFEMNISDVNILTLNGLNIYMDGYWINIFFHQYIIEFFKSRIFQTCIVKKNRWNDILIRLLFLMMMLWFYFTLHKYIQWYLG